MPLPPNTPVFCLSSQDWDDHLWTNKQHLMLRLSQRGFSVTYVCRKSRPFFTGLFKPKQHRLSDTLSLFQVTEIPFSGVMKATLNYERFGHKLDSLRSYIAQARLSTGQIPIIWAYDPGYGHYLDKLPKPYFLIYDCVDDYASFPANAKDPQYCRWIQEGEQRLLAAANVVTTTSLALYEHKKQFNSNTHYVHNVGDFDHFNRVMSDSFTEPDIFSNCPHPRIGFFGAVSSYKLDVPLLEQLARINPNYHYCLLGPIDRHEKHIYDRLEAMPNVHFFGKISYKDLPRYIQHLDVLMIPYALNTHTSHVFPIKFFEYLATGKPVVVTPLPAYNAYMHAVLSANSPDQFYTEITKALSHEHGDSQSLRIALAKQHDWNSRLNAILALITR